MPEPTTLFECPICGSNAYDTVYDTSNAVFGSDSIVLYYECSQCSVLFADPKKFTDVKSMKPKTHAPEILANCMYESEPMSTEDTGYGTLRLRKPFWKLW